MLAIICFLFDSKLVNLDTFYPKNDDGIMLDALLEVILDVVDSLID